MMIQKNKHKLEDKVKKLRLEEGQMFGEDEILRMIINNGNHLGPEPITQFYTVTCESNEAEIIYANVDDIFKMVKGEKRLLRFLKDEYVRKFPSNDLADSFFESAFSRQLESAQTNSTQVIQNKMKVAF